MIRPARGQVRPTAARPAALKAKTFPAPRRGWVLSENFAMQSPETALTLDNWFPTTTGIRVRGGRAKRATLAVGVPVRSMWEYIGAGSRQRFAADLDKVYDITTPSTPTTPITATVTGQTSGYYATVQMTTTGGIFQYCFNGTNSPLLYDGTSFTPITGVSTPFITGVTTSTLSHGWVYANRIFMVQKDTQTAWYLPVDVVGGVAQDVSLAGVFQDGGALLFGATWSLDAGDGINQKCVFVSTTGEVAIYQGTDPSDATKWALQGVYNISRPLGMKAIMQAGGDLLIATEEGIIALSEAVNKDSAALSLSAVTRAIEPEWRKEAKDRISLPIEILKWPSNSMMVVSLPPVAGLANNCLVCNIQTGAWCRFTNWQTRCMALFNGRGYFGANDGCVYEMEAGGSDDGAPYTAFYSGGFDHLEAPGLTKTITMARCVFRAASPIIAKVSGAIDYAEAFPSAPSSPADFLTSDWDVGLWDAALWDTSNIRASYKTGWVGIGETGFSFAPQVQLTYGVTPLPRVELVAFDVVYEPGGMIV
jgi:hypothetical protein